MLTTKEAAELLGITPRRVQELIKNGALTARKASGVWLIDSAPQPKEGDGLVAGMGKAKSHLPS